MSSKASLSHIAAPVASALVRHGAPIRNRLASIAADAPDMSSKTVSPAGRVSPSSRHTARKPKVTTSHREPLTSGPPTAQRRGYAHPLPTLRTGSARRGALDLPPVHGFRLFTLTACRVRISVRG